MSDMPKSPPTRRTAEKDGAAPSESPSAAKRAAVPPLERKSYPLSARRPAKLSDWLAREILGDIVASGLQPGARLATEQETVTRYGVSRASVREAFRLLESHGIINTKAGPKGGQFVAEITPAKFGRSSAFFFEAQGSTLREVAEYRLELDPVMVRRAAEQQWEPGIARIRLYLEGGPTRDGDWIETSDAFHGALVSATGNRVLDLMAASMHMMYNERTKQGGTYTDADETETEDQHIGIAEAVLAGDAEAASNLMRAHSIYLYEYAEREYPSLLDAPVLWR